MFLKGPSQRGGIDPLLVLLTEHGARHLINEIGLLMEHVDDGMVVCIHLHRVSMSFMNFPLMTYIKEISPRPVLFIHGEKAHMRVLTERFMAYSLMPILNLTYVKHKPGSRMIVLVIIVLSPFLSLKTVLLEIYFMN